jgi:hypothetical protein
MVVVLLFFLKKKDGTFIQTFFQSLQARTWMQMEVGIQSYNVGKSIKQLTRSI